MNARRTWVALLRGIGPATHKAMPMAGLRAAAEDAGFGDVATVLATGNLLLTTDQSEAALAKTFAGIVAGFGLSNHVFLRRPAELRATRAVNPFPQAAEARPSRLLIHFLATDASQLALADWGGPERVAVRGRAVFIDYAEGVGGSRLTPARLQRALGQSGTARNWNTLGKLIDRTAGAD